MVLYFSGTGNSKYIAGLLADRLEDGLTDAAGLIKSGEHPAFVSEKPYVFVAPVYAWRFPRVFEEWIKACRFEGNKNAYFVLTCGQDIGAAGKHLDAFATEIGFAYKGTAAVVMPDNYIILFVPDDKEKERSTVSQAEQYTQALGARIAQGAEFEHEKVNFLDRLKSGMVNNGFYTFYINAEKFYTTDACISCGACADVCMLNNITLKEGKPVWGEDCTHCMACICRCPREAIEYGKKTRGKRRYVCEKEK